MKATIIGRGGDSLMLPCDGPSLGNRELPHSRAPTGRTCMDSLDNRWIDL